MAHLSLSFLGPFQVTLDGQPVTRFESAKVRALLAYLAVEAHRPHPRETLTGLLWPGYAQSSALTNLRRALSNLRACIGDREADPPYLLVSREAIRWNPDSDYDLDVAALERAALDQAARGRTAATGDRGPADGAESDPAQLAACAPLYRGPFLEGLVVNDSPAYEAWQRAQREHLQERYLVLLDRLGERYERAGDYPQAQRVAQRQVDLDPLREGGRRRLMRALALAGDRNAALARYQALCATLAQELGVEPAPETTALYEQIRRGALLPPPPEAGPTHEGPMHEGPMPVGPIHELALPQAQIPEPALPLFVARERELAQLDQWLAEALRGRGRVGFVVGDPGSGKTALLREFARRAMQAHPQLVVAEGDCNAYAGMGDPYLPFVEALRLLTGDVQIQLSAEALSQEHAGRLLQVAPEMLAIIYSWFTEGFDTPDLLEAKSLLGELAAGGHHGSMP